MTRGNYSTGFYELFHNKASNTNRMGLKMAINDGIYFAQLKQKSDIMENLNPVVELLIYFGLGLVLIFGIVPLLMVLTSKDNRSIIK